MKINVFINEMSIEGQFPDIDSFKKEFLSLLSNVECFQNALSVKVEFYYDNSLLNRYINNSYNQLSDLFKDKDIKNKYQMNRDRYWKKWRDNLIHNKDDKYLYKTTNYSDTSVAESYEYTKTYSKDISILLNFPSSFASPKINVIKDNTSLEIHSYSKEEDINDFLLHESLVIGKYNDKCLYPPRDYQTILVDSTQFKPSPYRNHNRRVYERIGKDEYWCVDNFHTNGSAHLEIFQMSDGSFKGTCKIDDITAINTKMRKKEKSKKIQLTP